MVIVTDGCALVPFLVS